MDLLPEAQNLPKVLVAPIALALIVVAWLWNRWRKHGPVADDPDQPYRVYTRDYDLELAGADVPARLRDASLDFHRGWTDRTGAEWKRNRTLVSEFAGRQPPVETLVDTLRRKLGAARAAPADLAVTLLIDQSGSMRGEPIAATAAALACTSQALNTIGIAHEILGFSTAGWHGGSARKAWLDNGRRPKRPGRLCALLHTVYKRFDEAAWNGPSREAFVHPDILRENIDGEALEWAAMRAKAGPPASRRLLILLSDGAPVDDATLTHNGLGYLERHLRSTVARLERDAQITLGGVGICHDVANYFRDSRTTDLQKIASTVVELLSDLAYPTRKLAPNSSTSASGGDT